MGGMTGVLTSGSNSMTEYHEGLSSEADWRRLEEQSVWLLTSLVGDDEEEAGMSNARQVRTRVGPYGSGGGGGGAFVGDIKDQTQIHGDETRRDFTSLTYAARGWRDSLRTRQWQQSVLLTYWTVPIVATVRQLKVVALL